MDESTFKSKMFHAEVMRSTENRPDYWAGYCRGLRRAYHGDRFGTKEDSYVVVIDGGQRRHVAP